MSKLYINPDITQAETLPASFYRSQEIFEQMKEAIFVKSWQFIGDSSSLVPLDNFAYPFSFMENYLHEPMVLVRNKQSSIRCMSNVCTHRGNLIAQNPGNLNRELSCMYHGRRWNLNGKFKHMPEFNEAKDFPRPCDHLHQFKLEEWGPFLFTGLNPEVDFLVIRNFLDKYVGFLPLNEFKIDPISSKDYLVNCHWSLYCDNYLEGFHIPFVHPDLNAVLDYDSYATELFDYGTLQIGYADGAEETYKLPEAHPLYGKEVAAFYFWIFPNIMLNFYPWGLSVNVVKPISSTKTKVSFITYLHGENRFEGAASKLMDKVEREDEFVVEGVHQGLQSRFYKAGRFSPTREQGVHHFHRMLAERL
ncbi:aromatic ring-hydroxylating oxygenase subunit alpha [Croceitalea vernalis]|uniref:Aromatic ring-hydroxylating dioxygenase subunit alpha n=1 Tax=Croceitalea vernalis TaxID=3075599 RepID=A0ABU3BGK3_9FLAO|nr:aromatic ring-hydroxylating dioxygenase subunit alpha [Croceitalea sp. P007]MDT0621286.1 aromatic ring-hydroxylating dioxygenase subunit alpha [Croceitalea sp. P007]